MGQVIKLLWIGAFSYGGFFVVGFEGGVNIFGAVHKVQHKGIVFAGSDAVEAGEGLNGLDSGKAFVYKHGVEEGLVKAGLEFVGDQ